MPSARAVLAKATSEEELLIAITDALTLYQYVWTHTRRSDKAILMGHAGVPDIIAAKSGVVLMAELKAAGEQLTSEQYRWLRAAGWLDVETQWGSSRRIRPFLWRPADLDAALAELSRP